MNKLKNKDIIIKHDYDLDLIETYHICKENGSVEFANQVKEIVEYDLKRKLLDSIKYFDLKIPYVIPLDSPEYPHRLALRLIWYDLNRIDRFLDYQQLKFNKKHFVDLIEYQVYDLVKRMSLFDNSVRLKKIIDWVKEKRKDSNQQFSSLERNILSFGFKELSNEKLLKIYTYLNDRVNFIKTNLTSENDFIEVFTTKNLLRIKTKIYLGCETTQFKYIVEKMQPYFYTLNPTAIERSKLFYSKRGELITRGNLYSSKIHDVKGKSEISEFFLNLNKNI